MADVAEKGMTETGKITQAGLKTIKDFLAFLAEILEKNGNDKALKALADYVRKGKQLQEYSIQGDKCGQTIAQLKAQLDAQNIPYVEENGQEEKILIIPEDYERIKLINRNILVLNSMYYQEYDADAMENAVANSKFKDSDKNIFTMHGLSAYECEVIKNKCNDISKGFMVGTKENPDGTFDLSVLSNKDRVFSMDATKNDFCKAYLKAQFSLYGPNHDIKTQQIDADRQFNKQLSELKEVDHSYYIVGIDNKNHYIELTPEGFIEHNLRMGKDAEGNKVMLDRTEEMSRSDPDFELTLQRATDKIRDKVITDDKDRLDRHFSSPKREFEPDRPIRTKSEANRGKAEKECASRIDAAIKVRVTTENITFKDDIEKFQFFENEAATILQNAISGERTPEYSVDVSKEIRTVFTEFNVDISEYKNIPDEIQKYDAEVHKAKAKSKEKDRPDTKKKPDEKDDSKKNKKDSEERTC